MVHAFKGKLKTAHVTARFTRDYIGGQPASIEGIKAFVKHHLHLEGEEAENAVKRIDGQEVQQISGGTDEVDEKQTYGLNVIRRTSEGFAYVGTWQARAMIKQAASRLGLFAAKGKVGSKGDLAEAMLVSPAGDSACAGSHEIIILEDGKPSVARIFKKFMGSVSTPKGRMSIVHDSEIAPAGSMIQFSVQWPSGKITESDMAAVMGLCERVGMGSVRSLEHGRFEVVELTIE